MRNITYIVLLISVALSVSAKASVVADFDDLQLAPDSYWNGSDGSGGFTSGSASFSNNFTDWGGGVTSWDGFAYSNMTDNSVAGLDGQHNAMTGAAQSGSNYAVSFIGFAQLPTMTLASPGVVDGLYVTNNSYAYHTIRDGDDWTLPFSDGDWFTLSITGLNSQDQAIGTVDTYLADYRDGKSDILNTWQFVDLSSLGAVSTLEFSLASSDTGDWGMNTPAYFALDTVVPEPATMLLMAAGSMLAFRRKKS